MKALGKSLSFAQMLVRTHQRHRRREAGLPDPVGVEMAAPLPPKPKAPPARPRPNVAQAVRRWVAWPAEAAVKPLVRRGGPRPGRSLAPVPGV